jgi:arylsulfatase A-like enzyme
MGLRHSIESCLRFFAGAIIAASATVSLALPAHAGGEKSSRPNIVFILNDDQRYDAMGFLDPSVSTPNMDRIARNGVHMKNAFVTTALCSPSRASIITGQYMHDHGIADNNTGFAKGTVFFPSLLQRAGYRTAFVGKWHMGGHGDDPQPGFDHWVSFAGQGNYLPVNAKGEPNMLNVDGKRVAQKGYITDELTSYAIDWLGEQSGKQPFFLYLSHKAVHSDFIPADRHKGQSTGAVPLPPSMLNSPENRRGKPMWVQNQRNSWHGVEFPYHSELDLAEYRRRYNQTLLAVDEGIGRVIRFLEERGELDNTIFLIMGDNGFLFGEHGLIDKRNAYEESMRVPLIMSGPGIAKGAVVQDVVAGIDIAPTFLELAGARPMKNIAGRSFAAQARTGRNAEKWRDALLYEYYWEYNYPQTPTTFALRTDRYKLIQYHGVWDTEELYDLEADPKEMRNLIEEPSSQAVATALRARLYDVLTEGRKGLPSVTFSERLGVGAVFRSRKGSSAAEFPDEWLRKDGDPDVRRHTANEGGKKR